ncbi:MAG: response regulator [Balneolaceae bacterium]|nr:MAG: response regulator [Balneolaceae bacterium]
MKNINALVIEPSKTVRKRLEAAIAETPDIALLGSTGLKNGTDLKAKITESPPDVLLLGIDSKDSDEMEMFGYMRKNHSGIPILIMTHHNRNGAEIAISTLKKGAVEFFPKSSILSGAILDSNFFKNRVIPVIKAVPRLNRNILLNKQYFDNFVDSTDPISSDYFKDSQPKIKLLSIVGCLGGVAPLYLLLSSLPNNLPVPVIVVQHMVEIYSEVLVEDLNRYASLTVKQAEDGEEIKPGSVYVAPGNYHVVTRRLKGKPVLKLDQRPKVAGFRPSIDIFLKSSTNLFGNKTLTVYLSGGGLDGIEGAKSMDFVGGQVIVQNRNTSLLSDISWKVESLGINEGAYPLERLAHEICKRLI